MNRDDDSWGALLNEEDLEAINYASDLENFCEHSFGNELSYKIICILLGNITKNLEDFSKGTNDVRAEFRFASSATFSNFLQYWKFLTMEPFYERIILSYKSCF